MDAELWHASILFFLSMTVLFVHTLIHKNTPIHYITVATKPHPVLTHIQDSCHSNGEEVVVLGLHEGRDIGWKGKGNFGIKLRELHYFINNPKLGDSDIILFSDAYDVAIVGSQKEIKHRFLTFQKPIVFGAEKACHPDKNRAPQYGIKLPGVEFQYLNSGLIIGRVWALRQCMSDYKYKDAEDDQRFWTTQYFKRRDLIELDSHAKLFLNCAFVDQKDIEYNKNTRVLTYSKTQTHPLLIHANGHDKSALYDVIGRWNEPPNE
jgi:hypothetical protein